MAQTAPFAAENRARKRRTRAMTCCIAIGDGLRLPATTASGQRGFSTNARWRATALSIDSRTHLQRLRRNRKIWP
jgi:hypothetical protein